VRVGTSAHVPAEVRFDLPAHNREIRRTRAARPPGPKTSPHQRGPAPVRGPGRPARRRSRPSAALVGLVTPTSSPRPYLPLPTTGPLATVKITIYGWNTNLSISGGAVAAVWARQWRRDPVMVLRALATLTRMARANCVGGEARGRRVEQSAWVVLWLVRADYPLVSRPGVSSPRSWRPVTWPGA
jgi:hypothetical protein